MNTQLTTQVQDSAFSLQGFEHAQRIAVMISKSDIIPANYKDKVANCMIALEMAHRSGTSPLIVMQNLHIIQGKPSWASSYVIAMINASGKFTQELRFTQSGTDDDYGYEAWTISKADNEKLIGPKVDWKMVKAEGWLSKAGSKWKTMPELMFRYRAAAFFGRLYTPELMNGLQTQEEVIDVVPVSVETVNNEIKVAKEKERVIKLIASCDTTEALKKIESDVPDDLLDVLTVKKDELKQAGK